VSEGEMTIGGYQLKNCVASGNTTQIWEVEVPGSPAQLAMKLMLDEARKISAEKNVLKHEYKIGKLMTHPTFLRFHEMEINRDHAFFVMDFFRSPSLKTHITSNLVAVQASFSKLAESLVGAFKFMHEAGWLHRDIKPDNILVNRAGEARVIDFSLSAKIKGKFGLIVSGKQKSIQGTRTYIAPETILRKAPTERTDLYSLGVTFFEVLTGQPPFAGDSPNALLKKHLGEDAIPPSALNPNVTKELDRVILQMLQKNPAKRYQSMQELESALRGVRCFDVDPLELQAQKQAAAKKVHDESVDQRLNSRADADRTLKGVVAPGSAKKEKKLSLLFLREEEERKKGRAARGLSDEPTTAAPAPMPQQPMMPQMPMQYPGMPMQYPGMPMQYPQMPMQYPGMPQMPMQQQPYPGMPMPPMQYPGMPQQMPQYPQGIPQQPAQMPAQPQVPGQQAPPAVPAPQQAPPPPAPQQPAPPPAPVPVEEPQEATLDDFLIE
jgi:eukaryotic-like serine/threonine-protein kinase